MIHFVVGTRAQLFKHAPIMRECQSNGLNWRWIYTAQHKETIRQSWELFELKSPDVTVVKWDTEAKTISKMLYWLFVMMVDVFRGQKLLGDARGKQHIVVTHGDTITTWWGALLGRLNRCQVMHVEAGLRSHNLFDPFPEEINRIMTGWLSTMHVVPGEKNAVNLRKTKGEIIITDANTQADTIEYGLQHCDGVKLALPKQKYAVVSLHRYENIFNKDQFAMIITQLEVAAKNIHLLFVLHPATESQLKKFNLRKRLEQNKQISLLPRQEYLQFIKLIKHSQFVITDGGGNQEELHYLGKPTLIFRKTTERNEGIDSNAVLSKLDETVINEFYKNYKKYQTKPIKVKKSASKFIASTLSQYS